VKINQTMTFVLGSVSHSYELRTAT